jgi:FkbM family methyltransferase
MLVTEKLPTGFGDLEVPVHEPILYGALKLRGEYCPGEARTYASLVKPGDTVVDVGANIGFFTLVFARAVGRTGRVIAIEPQRSIYEILSKNIHALDADRVEIRRAIASDRLGNQPFVDIHTLDADTIAWLGSASVDYAMETAHATMVETEVMTIDSLGLPRCDFIKIDVEGHESQVLNGARETMERCLPILAVEADLQSREYGFVDDLAELGYQFHLLTALYVRQSPEDAGNPTATQVRGFEIGGMVSRMLIGVPIARKDKIPDRQFTHFRPIANIRDLKSYLANNTQMPHWSALEAAR